MFLGHYGVAFALKRAEPKISLGTLFVATQLVDILWGVFLVFGWEHVRVLPDDNPLLTLQFYDYPISHSLVGGLAWGLVAAALYYSWPTRDTTRHWQASALVGAAAASHWLLDLIVHLRDLPLMGNDTPKLGLGLWRHVGLTIGLELLMLAAGSRSTCRAARAAIRCARSGWRCCWSCCSARMRPRSSPRRRRA